MVIYIAQVGILILLSLLLYSANIGSVLSEKIYIIISFFILLFVQGLRGYSVGTDTLSYLQHYAKDTYWTTMEAGFAALSFSIKSISDNNSFYLFCISGIQLFVLFVAIIRLSKEPRLSILFYILFAYYIQSFNIARQYIAISFYLVALSYAKEKKFSGFIFFVLLSSLFHISGLISLIFFIYFIPDIFNFRFVFPSRGSKAVFIYMVIPLCVITSLFIISFFFSSVFKEMVRLFFPTYFHYFSSLYLGEAGGYAQTVISICIYLGYYFFSTVRGKERIINLFLICCGTVISLLAINFVLLNRVSLYFNILWIFYLPELIVDNNIRSLYPKVMFQILLVLLGIVYFSYLLTGSLFGAKEYYFFFQK